MIEHRYINEPLPKLTFDRKRSRVKYCPCGKSNKDGKFVPYLGYENKGYCHSCGETFLPELPKQEQGSTLHSKAYKHRPAAPQPQPVSFIPADVFERSLQQYTENNFVKFLFGLFGAEITLKLIEKYFIGTSKHWSGATIFWQIDTQGKVRTGKIMLYSPTTGKRIKEPFNHIHWVHKAIKQPEFNLRQCFFGEHLLIDKIKPVAIVESEKTAVIASVYLPGFIWLAAGSKDGLNIEKCSVLSGRNVSLFPDLNGFEKWSEKAKEIEKPFPGTRVAVSTLLERHATEAERQDGLDLADYLIRFDYKHFQQQQQPEPQQSEPEQPQQAETKAVQEFQPDIQTFSQTEPKGWTDEKTELERFFETATIPAVPVKLNKFSTITNCSLFIESHLATVKANNGNKTFLPYLYRLRQLKQKLTSHEDK